MNRLRVWQLAAKRIPLVEDEHDVADMLGVHFELKDTRSSRLIRLAAPDCSLSGDGCQLLIADYGLSDGNGLDVADKPAKDAIKTVIISGHLFLIPGHRARAHELIMKPTCGG